MSKLPRHIAIIMDGNGRWAQKKGLPRIAGHRAGEKAARKIVRACNEFEIGVLSLFAFSRENWNRPSKEVATLMDYFFQFLRKDSKELHKKGIRIHVMGDCSQLATKIQVGIKEVHELTAANKGLKLNIAINYSGKWDIVQAAKKLATKVAAGDLNPEQIDESTFNSMTSLAELPEPDLFIRTSGEERISNFMLWQLAYTELYFTDTLWPDFDEEELQKALTNFASRERRFGTLNVN